jgi:hypothetical protein
LGLGRTAVFDPESEATGENHQCSDMRRKARQVKEDLGLERRKDAGRKHVD